MIHLHIGYAALHDSGLLSQSHDPAFSTTTLTLSKPSLHRSCAYLADSDSTYDGDSDCLNSRAEGFVLDDMGIVVGTFLMHDGRGMMMDALFRIVHDGGGMLMDGHLRAGLCCEKRCDEGE